MAARDDQLTELHEMVLVEDKKLVGDLDVGDAFGGKIVKVLDDVLRFPVAEHRGPVGKFILLAVDDIDHAKGAFHRTAQAGINGGEGLAFGAVGIGMPQRGAVIVHGQKVPRDPRKIARQICFGHDGRGRIQTDRCVAAIAQS